MHEKISTYKEAVRFIDGLSSFYIKLGLDTIRALCSAFGEPQKAFPSILVAGTNGKGSVCSYLSTILRKSGYKTGLYTSPHLADLRERIKIDGQMIPEQRFADILEKARNAADGMSREKKLEQYPTYFEFLTAVAFLWFKEEKIDIGVMEIGLGGRFDAVNIIDPILSVITEIDYDHQKHLGKTLTAIAGEKAGVMRKGKPVVLSVGKPRPKAVLKSLAREKQAIVFDARENTKITVRDIPSDETAGSGKAVNPVRKRMENNVDVIDIVTPKDSYCGIIPSLPGRHQWKNIAAAVGAAERLSDAGYTIDAGDIIFGIENAEWEGRLEWKDWKLPLLLDGGHNPSGIRSLEDYLNRKLSSKRFSLIFACKTSKDYKKMCETLFPLARRIILPRVEGYQFVDPSLLQQSAAELNKDNIITESLDEAFAKAAIKKDIDFILITGSLHLVGEVINYLKRQHF